MTELVDARGLRCPLPVIRLARAAKDAAEGTAIELLSTDPAAGPDVAAWCRMRGQELVSQREEADGVLRSTVRVRAARAGAAPPAPPPAGGGSPRG